MPGARRAKSARVHRLSALWSLADASRVAWRLRERRLQRQDRFGPLLRMVEAGQCQQAADVLLVPRSERLHARLGADVVLAVRQAEPALQQEGDVGLLAVDAGFHRKPKHVGRAVDAPVERVDVGAESAAEEPGQRRLVPTPVDAVQQRLERRDAPRLDGGLVQLGRAEVGDLARERPAGAAPASSSSRATCWRVSSLISFARGPAVLACRDLGGPEPTAVGVGEEVVARLDARVDAAFERPSAWPVERLRGGYAVQSAAEARHQPANSHAPRGRETLDMSVTFEQTVANATGRVRRCSVASPCRTGLDQFRTSTMPK